ncbi:MAG TPA: DUF262 domain-containing protein [Sphingobium sp.]
MATTNSDDDFAPLDQQEDEADVLDGGKVVRFDAAVAASDWTTETVISQLRKGNIYLDPDFQRRDAWTVQRKSQYIESLIIGIPTPQIILAERKEKRGSYIVIDGKQRLLSLRQFSASSSDTHFKPFALKGLAARADLNDQTYEDIAQSLFGDFTSDFDNATIRTVVIKSWPSEEFLYEVFLRINSGSVQLSPQELRQALHPGPFTKRLNEFVIESKILQGMLGLRQPDFRMRDNELALRYVSFMKYLQRYSGNLKLILDDTTRILNSSWESEGPEIEHLLKRLEYSIGTTEKVFGNRNMFKKWNGDYFETRINRAVFDVIALFFSNEKIAELALENREKVVAAFKTICEHDYDFVNSITSTTKSFGAVQYRFNAWAQALSNALNIKIHSPI